MAAVVEVRGLVKRYGAVAAVDGVDLRVGAGTVYGLVGPNGAGKTTTVECIEGLRRPDAGEVRVFGLDPVARRAAVYRRLGVQLQESSMYHRIRVREALRLFGSFFPDPLPPGPLLAELGLEECADAYYGKLSGGQKRKLLTAVALVGRPELVILDEPTSGLDPQSRQAFWSALGRYRGRGLTVLLTTHDLVEAEENCDLVAVVDRGRVVALGSPRELLHAHRLGVRVTAGLAGNGFDAAGLSGHPGLTRMQVIDDRLYLYGEGEDFLASVSRRLQAAGVRDVASRTANLEDVYLTLTGRGYAPGGGEEVAP